MSITAIPTFRPRDPESFRYAQQIYQPYGTINDVIDWCKQSLQQDWAWTILDSISRQSPGCYEFYFDNEQDLCAFLLRWS